MKAADAARPRRKPGGPRWETPDPPGIAGTYGTAAIEWARRELKLELDPWQAYVVRRILRHDKAGDLIHRIALLSTGRQNGKSVVVRTIFGWMLDEGRTLPPFAAWREMLTAAHDAKQARLVYKGVLADLGSIPRIAGQARGTRYRSVRLTEQFGIKVGDLELDIVTSQPGSTRGHAAGAIAWDEMLTQRDWAMWEALSPTQSAQRSPIMLLTSTAGFADSIVLRAFYDRLVRLASGDDKADHSFYGAWWQSDTAEAGFDLRALKQANPSLGRGRLKEAALRSEHSILPTDSYVRERLNHWVDVKVATAFAPGVWAKLRTPAPLDGVDPPYVLGVDVQPGWERATVVAAALRPDGRIGAEVFRDLRAEDGAITADTLIAAIESFPHPVSIVAFDSYSGAAAAFGRHGESAWGTEWRAYKPNMVAAACMDATEMILSGRLAVDDPLLDVQITWVAKRDVGQDGAFRFGRAASTGPIDGIMALTFAAAAAARQAPAPSII